MATIMVTAQPIALAPRRPAITFFPTSGKGNRPPPLLVCGSEAAPKRSSRYWAITEAEIETHLAASIPTGPPQVVRDPMLSLVSSATQTIAPVICVAACELMGGLRDHALGAACSLRLLHTAGHAKRPLLGLWVPPGSADEAAFSDGVRLQTVDGLMTLSYQLVAETGAAGAEPDRVLKVLVEMADAAGPQGLVEGQYEDKRHVQEMSDQGWLDRICRKKEGRLSACAAACGAILAGAGEEETKRLRSYGMYVGMLHGLLLRYGQRPGSGHAPPEEVVGQLKSLALSELDCFKGPEEMMEAIVWPVSSVQVSGRASTS